MTQLTDETLIQWISFGVLPEGYRERPESLWSATLLLVRNTERGEVIIAKRPRPGYSKRRPLT